MIELIIERILKLMAAGSQSLSIHNPTQTALLLSDTKDGGVVLDDGGLFGACESLNAI